MRILVINPNSNAVFTRLMRASLAPLQAASGWHIDCEMLDGTPPGIESQRDIDSVIEPLCAMVAQEAARTDAFVIGCFADTGLYSAREITDKPVLGICESGLASALCLGERFGVISTSTESRNAELRLARSYGLLDRCVGFAPIDIPVADIPTDPTAKDRVFGAAENLKSNGADVLVLGCAGMTPYRDEVRRRFGLPVIDPCISTVAMAISAHLQRGPQR